MSKPRPISPHLAIYRMPVAVLLSITHRATGVLLAIAAVVLVYWLNAVAGGPQAYAAALSYLGAWYGSVFLSLCAFGLYFHLCNGIRHLVWDAGWGFDLKVIDASGYAVLIASVVLTVATWLLV
ncbi:MAG: succinate dehydrogenase, cytochrome b556 subunit [Gammaproteobacteria bacterium]